jgi:hypothetical protein
MKHVYINAAPDRVRQYLPNNYTVAESPADGPTLVVGQDVAGWTLEDYVLPRLASGLMFPVRITTADGKRVTIGDRVFNYYDGRWGTIVRIESTAQPDTMRGQNSNTPIEEWDNYWFWLDNGDYLDGSRISTREP